MAEEDTGSTETGSTETGSTELPITLDAGNGNEPPPKMAASADISGLTEVGSLEVGQVLEGGSPEAGQAPEVGEPRHVAHDWLDTLIVELRDIDEVVKNRLHHIVERIRETL